MSMGDRAQALVQDGEMEKKRAWRLSSPPLSLQIMGLLLGGLVVAQLATLMLTLLLPPEPQQQYGLGDIARVLAGENVHVAGSRQLQRIVQAGPPALSGPGWLTSERSRRELAALLARDESDVQLSFFTPLPFAGTTARPARAAALETPVPQVESQPSGFMRANFSGGVQMAQAGPPPNGFPGGFPGRFPGGPPPGAFPGGPPAAALQAPSAPSFAPPSGLPSMPGGTPASPSLMPSAPPSRGVFPQGGMPGGVPGNVIPGGGAPPAVMSAPAGAPPVGAPPATPPMDIAPPVVAPTQQAAPPPPAIVAPRPTAPSAPVVTIKPDAPVIPHQAVAPAVPAPEADPLLEPPVPVVAPSRGLFGLAPAPFVEGDFVAALKLDTGQWAVVQPVPEAFPNSWQRRVLLWFLLSFALVAPLGLIFARRVVRPIAGFALAAEQLGRDPTASVLALEGPAEVGRAAHAFNRMQSRLRSFVDDRTAFVGAISHDLRTPLTRLRFRIEDAPDELREGMLAEVDEMEQMITSVLNFIRNASEPGARERLDLRSLLEDVVEDAVFVGKDVTLEDSERAPVEVDALGMRRLLNNLVENAVKYGDKARVRLFTDQQDAVAEIRDNGPGLPDEELERVFQPFYRAPSARASAKHGTGLGLAVCRSIARAHGGDVRLTRGPHGLVAQVRLPLVYGSA